MRVAGEPNSGIDQVPGKIWLGLAFVISILAIYLRFTSLNTHDNSWLLYATDEFLNGAKLYVDLIEVNPPLVVFIYALPVALAKLIPLEVHQVFYAYVILLSALSATLVYKLAGAGVVANRALLMLLLAVALLVLPRENFGQREHFLVIFTLPYIFLVMRRAQALYCGRGLAVFIGLVAVFGFGLKHYFVIIPALLEIYLLFKTRSIKNMFRPETLALGVGLVAYVGLILIATPQYVSDIVPMALAVYTQGFTVPFIKIISSIELVVMVLVGLAGSVMITRGYRPSSDVVVLFIAGISGFLAFVMQAKGWNYQAYPALVFLFISAGLLTAEWSRHGFGKFTNFSVLLMATLVLLALPILSVMDYRYKNPTVAAWKKVFKQHPPVTSFFVMSSLLSPGFPLANVSGVKWASRFPSLWLMPGIAYGAKNPPSEATVKIAEVARYQLNAIVDDLTKFRPQIVFVDSRPKMTHFGNTSFDFIGYFSKDARFKALWSRYEKIGTDEFGFQHFRLRQQ